MDGRPERMSRNEIHALVYCIQKIRLTSPKGTTWLFDLLQDRGHEGFRSGDES